MAHRSPSTRIRTGHVHSALAKFIGVVLAALHDGDVSWWKHPILKAALLAGDVLSPKEREYSVEHRPHFVNLVQLSDQPSAGGPKEKLSGQAL